MAVEGMRHDVREMRTRMTTMDDWKNGDRDIRGELVEMSKDLNSRFDEFKERVKAVERSCEETEIRNQTYSGMINDNNNRLNLMEKKNNTANEKLSRELGEF